VLVDLLQYRTLAEASNNILPSLYNSTVACDARVRGAVHEEERYLKKEEGGWGGGGQ
jgi:hypothetical protein